MFKKSFIAVSFIFCIAVSGMYGYGIGVQFDGVPSDHGTSYGPSIAFKLDDIPLYFAVNLRIKDERVTIGATADWWYMNEPINEIPHLRWFWGFGAYGLASFGDPGAFALGGRIPVGLNAFFQDGFIEPYLQIAPSVGLILMPDVEFPDWFVPVSIGVRFWVK